MSIMDALRRPAHAFRENEMMTMASRILIGAGVAAVVAVCFASAQQPQTVRVRGTIEKVDGNLLVVKSRDDTDLHITLTNNVQVIGVVKASLDEIKPNSFIGSAAMPQADGSQKALEVHIFAESQRGTGEGHRPFTLPNSTMTNGTVGETVTGVDGRTLTVKYAGGEKKIIVSPGVPIVRYEVSDRSELKPGVAITIPAAANKPDGTLETGRVNVGRGGLVPQ
jgi:hypothetical protein